MLYDFLSIMIPRYPWIFGVKIQGERWETIHGFCLVYGLNNPLTKGPSRSTYLKFGFPKISP